jgi:hypothetical protein
VSSLDYLPIAGQTVTFSFVNPKTGSLQVACTTTTDFLGPPGFVAPETDQPHSGVRRVLCPSCYFSRTAPSRCQQVGRMSS